MHSLDVTVHTHKQHATQHSSDGQTVSQVFVKSLNVSEYYSFMPEMTEDTTGDEKTLPPSPSGCFLGSLPPPHAVYSPYMCWAVSVHACLCVCAPSTFSSGTGGSSSSSGRWCWRVYSGRRRRDRSMAHKRSSFPSGGCSGGRES